MNCARMESRILPYLDGRLKEDERAEAEKHLAACAVCRLRVNEFRSLSGLLDELPKIEPSADFDLRMQARIAAEPPRQSWWAWLAPSPRVAFAASLLLLATVWVASRPAEQGLNLTAPDTELRMMKDLPVLEDYDVLANFEPLPDLPPPVETENQ
jgi:anti-sigma factor RsiW